MQLGCSTSRSCTRSRWRMPSETAQQRLQTNSELLLELAMQHFAPSTQVLVRQGENTSRKDAGSDAGIFGLLRVVELRDQIAFHRDAYGAGTVFDLQLAVTARERVGDRRARDEQALGDFDVGVPRCNES